MLDRFVLNYIEEASILDRSERALSNAEMIIGGDMVVLETDLANESGVKLYKLDASEVLSCGEMNGSVKIRLPVLFGKGLSRTPALIEVAA